MTTTSSPPCPALPIGVSEVTLTAGGADHPVRVFVPSSFAGAALPTVVNWHGLGSTGPIQAIYSNYETVAELNGFIVVHPSGVDNSWQLFGGSGEARDDVAFANALIDQLVDQWCADESRIYSTGISNGGLFTARLVCELADRIAAAASVAGTYHPEGCVPDRPVPYLAYHGTLDNTVPFDGGGQITSTDGEGSSDGDFFAMVMPDEFAEFAADFGCSPEPETTDVGADVIRYDYAGCDDGTPMAFFEITGGGHTWPGSPLADAVAGVLGYTTDDVDATADSWAFFEQHRLDS